MSATDGFGDSQILRFVLVFNYFIKTNITFLPVNLIFAANSHACIDHH